MNILLYNHYSGSGHHDSWNALFTTLLLEAGHSVYSLTPSAEILLKTLNAPPNLPYIKLHILPWKAEQNASFREQLGRDCIQLLKTCKKALKKSFSLVRRQSGFCTDSTYVPLSRHPKTVSLTVVWARSIIESIFGPIWTKRKREIIERIREAVTSMPEPPDRIFILYADALFHPPVAHPATNSLSIPWGGICFAPSDFLDESIFTDQIFQDPMFRGFCLLDEDAVARCMATMPDRIFQEIPDTADSSLPNTPPPLVEELRKRAGKRTIVLLAGSIDDRKNLANFCKLIQIADPKRWFFAIIGQLHWETLGESDRLHVQNFLANPPENLMIHLAFIDQECEMNACIATADILFAVYKNFLKSSNMLGKTAAFGKPLLVGTGGLMEKRVKQYSIGAAVAPDNPQDMLLGLERLLDVHPEGKNYQSFMSENNKEILTQNLMKFIKRI